MKKRHFAPVFLLLAALVLVANLAYAGDKKADTGRMLTGRVSDRQDNSLPDAVLYLSYTRTQAVKTYTVGADGMYRFPELSLNVDYEVYAQFNGRKSEKKTVSHFDDRRLLNINLRVDTK